MLQLRTLLDRVVSQHLMEESSTKKDRSKMTLQESEQMPGSRPYSQVMEGGRSKMQYQQAEPLGLKEEGGEPPQH